MKLTYPLLLNAKPQDKPYKILDLASVQKHFSEAGVARQKTPESLYIVAELPRTASGKVRKPDLRRQVNGS